MADFKKANKYILSVIFWVIVPVSGDVTKVSPTLGPAEVGHIQGIALNQLLTGQGLPRLPSGPVKRNHSLHSTSAGSKDYSNLFKDYRNHPKDYHNPLSSSLTFKGPPFMLRLYQNSIPKEISGTKTSKRLERKSVIQRHETKNRLATNSDSDKTAGEHEAIKRYGKWIKTEAIRNAKRGKGKRRRKKHNEHSIINTKENVNATNLHTRTLIMKSGRNEVAGTTNSNGNNNTTGKMVESKRNGGMTEQGTKRKRMRAKYTNRGQPYTRSYVATNRLMLSSGTETAKSLTDNTGNDAIITLWTNRLLQGKNSTMKRRRRRKNKIPKVKQGRNDTTGRMRRRRKKKRKPADNSPAILNRQSNPELQGPIDRQTNQDAGHVNRQSDDDDYYYYYGSYDSYDSYDYGEAEGDGTDGDYYYDYYDSYDYSGDGEQAGDGTDGDYYYDYYDSYDSSGDGEQTDGEQVAGQAGDGADGDYYNTYEGGDAGNGAQEGDGAEGDTTDYFTDGSGEGDTETTTTTKKGSATTATTGTTTTTTTTATTKASTTTATSTVSTTASTASTTASTASTTASTLSTTASTASTTASTAATTASTSATTASTASTTASTAATTASTASSTASTTTATASSTTTKGGGTVTIFIPDPTVGSSSTTTTRSPTTTKSTTRLTSTTTRATLTTSNPQITFTTPLPIFTTTLGSYTTGNAWIWRGSNSQQSSSEQANTGSGQNQNYYNPFWIYNPFGFTYNSISQGNNPSGQSGNPFGQNNLNGGFGQNGNTAGQINTGFDPTNNIAFDENTNFNVIKLPPSNHNGSPSIVQQSGFGVVRRVNKTSYTNEASSTQQNLDKDDELNTSDSYIKESLISSNTVSSEQAFNTISTNGKSLSYSRFKTPSKETKSVNSTSHPKRKRRKKKKKEGGTMKIKEKKTLIAHMTDSSTTSIAHEQLTETSTQTTRESSVITHIMLGSRFRPPGETLNPEPPSGTTMPVEGVTKMAKGEKRKKHKQILHVTDLTVAPTAQELPAETSTAVPRQASTEITTKSSAVTPALFGSRFRFPGENSTPAQYASSVQAADILASSTEVSFTENVGAIRFLNTKTEKSNLKSSYADPHLRNFNIQKQEMRKRAKKGKKVRKKAKKAKSKNAKKKNNRNMFIAEKTTENFPSPTPVQKAKVRVITAKNLKYLNEKGSLKPEKTPDAERPFQLLG